MTQPVSTSEEHRLALASRLAASIAHAVGTPLNVILGRAAMLTMKANAEDAVLRNARIIEEQAKAIDRILRSTLSVLREGRPRNPSRWPVDDALREIVEHGWPAAEKLGVTVTTQSSGILADGRRSAFIASIEGLLEVAIHGSQQGESVLVESSVERAQPPAWDAGRAEPGLHTCIVVRPSRPLIMSERPHEPWFAPLGEAQIRSALAIAGAYEAAREHGGWVDSGPERNALRLVWSLQQK